MVTAIDGPLEPENRNMFLLILLMLFAIAWIAAETLERTLPTAPPGQSGDSDQWPPISEDEFIERCSPGVDRDRALQVRRIIARQLGVPFDRIYPEQSFVDDLGCD